MTKYKKTQYGISLNILLLLVSLGIFLAYWFQTGTKPLPFGAFIVIFTLFLGIVLLFYKLTITIDNEKIIAKLGIGILKKSIHLKDIAINSIEKVRMPWYYGIGIRLTPKGWLWNVKVGDAIYFKTKKNKTFLVGTDDYETIIKVLNNNVSSSEVENLKQH